MIIGPRRAVLIGAITAIVLAIIFIPFIVTIVSPDPTQARVRLTDVTVARVDEGSMQLRPVITIENPTDQTLTTSRIEFELFADRTSLGTHIISFEDIPLNGRPPIFAGGSVLITPTAGQPFVVEFDSQIADVYNRIQEDPTSIRWNAKGEAVIESTLVQQTVEFDSTL